MNVISKTYLQDLVYHINGAAIEVHKHLGPGLLENVYHKCLIKELSDKGIEVEANLKCDLFVENCLVVELKAIERVLPIHEAQLITYMKLLKVPIGLIINFNVTNIYKKRQKTYVNEFFRNLEE